MNEDMRTMAKKKPSSGRCFVACSATTIGCALSLLTAPAQAEGLLAERDATLQVCSSAPAVEVSRAERRRGEAAVTAAAVLPNPSLVGEHQRTLRGASEQETVVGVSVPLGIGGRRFILQDAASSKRDQARADAEGTLFDSAIAFREAYLRATADEARLAVLTEQQAALEGLSSAIQGLTKGGEAAGYDLLRQQAQSRRHAIILADVRARALSSRALLEAWLDAPAESTKLSTLTLPANAPTGMADAEPKSPQVRSLEAAARASEFEASAARRRWVPDLEVFGGYRTVSAGDATGRGISLGITVPITFFDHGQGEAVRAEADRDLALALAMKLRRAQRAEVRAARIRLEGLSRALADAEKATDETEQIQGKARALYAAGEASITELLEVFRTVEESRLTTIDLLEEMARTRLALMRASGTMFDQALDRACRGDAARSKR